MGGEATFSFVVPTQSKLETIEDFAKNCKNLMKTSPLTYTNLTQLQKYEKILQELKTAKKELEQKLGLVGNLISPIHQRIKELQELEKFIKNFDYEINTCETKVKHRFVRKQRKQKITNKLFFFFSKSLFPVFKNFEFSCRVVFCFLCFLCFSVISTEKLLKNWKFWNKSTFLLWLKNVENGKFAQFCDNFDKNVPSETIDIKNLASGFVLGSFIKITKKSD